MTLTSRNTILSIGYWVIYALLVLLTLNDYRIINLNENYQGILKGVGEETYTFIVANRPYTKQPAADIQVVLTRDKDIGKFPDQGDQALESVYLSVMQTKKDETYTDIGTGESEIIIYEEVREEYCTTIHANASSSRYGLVTALQNVLKQNPKVVILDYLFVGRSSHCPEYDQQLVDIIKSHNNVFVMAGNIPQGSQVNDMRDLDPSVYIHDTVKSSQPQSRIHDSMIYPFFKDIYRQNESLSNLGSGNILIDSSVITEARLRVESKNYSIPTVPLLVSKHLNMATTQVSNVRINWRDVTPTQMYPSTSLLNVIMPIEKKSFKDQIVLFGSNLTGRSKDRVFTPIYETAVAGVYVQATVLDNTINNDFITVSPEWVPLSITIGIITLLFFAFRSQAVLLYPYAGANQILKRLDRLRKKISIKIYSIFHFSIGEADFFIWLEFLAVLLSVLILLVFNHYIDFIAPLFGGSIGFFAFSIYKFFAHKLLVQRKDQLNGYKHTDKYKRIYLMRIDSLDSMDDQKAIVLKEIENFYNVSISKFSPFDDDDLFGSLIGSQYYWWVTLDKNDKTLKLQQYQEVGFSTQMIMRDLNKGVDIKNALRKII